MMGLGSFPYILAWRLDGGPVLTEPIPDEDIAAAIRRADALRRQMPAAAIVVTTGDGDEVYRPPLALPEATP